MATTAQDVLTRQIKRNVVLGTMFCFVLTVVICLPAGIGWGEAMLVAVLPAGFAGPFVGGLLSVVSWVIAEERETETHGAAVDLAPVVAPAIAISLPSTVALPAMTPTVAAAMALAGPTPTAR